MSHKGKKRRGKGGVENIVVGTHIHCKGPSSPSGGQVYYHQGFQAEIHGEKLRYKLSRDHTRETSCESVMREGCVSPHIMDILRSPPAGDCDKAFVAQLGSASTESRYTSSPLEDQLLMTQAVYFQAALLYTSPFRERRIRVHTAAAPVVTDLVEMYRMVDTGAHVACLSRLAIEKTMSYKLEDARQSVQSRIMKDLKEYWNLCVVQHRLGGRMIYPVSLEFLFLYGLAVCKSVPLRGGHADVQLDERCATDFTMMAMNKLRDKHASADAEDFENAFQKLPLTRERLDLIWFCDGLHFVIWWCHDIGCEEAANKHLLETVFHVMMRLFIPRRMTMLFVIRDKTRTPSENLEHVLREDIQKIWDTVPSPQRHPTE